MYHKALLLHLPKVSTASGENESGNLVVLAHLSCDRLLSCGAVDTAVPGLLGLVGGHRVGEGYTRYIIL